MKNRKKQVDNSTVSIPNQLPATMSLHRESSITTNQKKMSPHKLYFCFVNSNNLRSKEELVDRRLNPTLLAFASLSPLNAVRNSDLPTPPPPPQPPSLGDICISMFKCRHLVHWSGSLMCLCLQKCLMPNPKLTCYSSWELWYLIIGSLACSN